MQRKDIENFTLPFLLLITVLFHLLLFNRFPLQFDELLMVDLVSKMPFSNLIHYLFNVEVQMPLPYMLSKFLVNVGLDHTFFLRLHSLLSFFAMAFGFYHLCHLSFDKKRSLKATILLMSFYPMFEFSGSMRPNAIMLFLSVLLTLELKKAPGDQSFRRFLLLAFILFLTHPMGVIFSLFALFLFLIRQKKSRLLLSAYALISLFFISAILFLRLHDVLYILGHKGHLFDLRKIAYIFSGPLFFILIITLGFLLLLKVKSIKKLAALFDQTQLTLFLLLLFSGIALFIFFPHYIHPRHLLLILPPLSFLLVQLSESLESRFFYLMLFCLWIKAFSVENIFARPYEIDSRKMALKASVLSEGKTLIVNCGNCLSYYLRGNRYECIGPSLNLERMQELKKINKDIILIHFDYSKDICSPDYLSGYSVKEQYKFIGGNVFKLSRLP